MLDELKGAGELDAADHHTGLQLRGRPELLLSIAVSAGLGFLGGMLLGRKKGEAAGLAVGLELGRTEAMAALAGSHGWRGFWRRREMPAA